MKRTVYVAIRWYDDDIYDFFASYEKASAIEAAESDRLHLSCKERRCCDHSVCSYLLDVAEGMSAEDAWRKYLESEGTPDGWYSTKSFKRYAEAVRVSLPEEREDNDEEDVEENGSSER